MVQQAQTVQGKEYKIVAAIPCFNTEDSIRDVVSKSRRYVDQVIVVDDGSRDATGETARAAGALVVAHPVNRGYGESIKSCLKSAMENDADFLIILDGDGQHNPDELPFVLAPVVRGEADLSIGSRFIKWQTNMPRYRKFGIKVINFLCNFGAGVKVSDTQSGFRAYSRGILDSLSLAEKGMGLSAEVLLKVRERQLNIKEVPISCRYHSESSSLNPVFHGLGVALTVLKLRTKNLVSRFLGVLHLR